MTRSQLPQTVTGEPRAFFGRRSGKRLHHGQEQLFRTVLPRLEIHIEGGRLDPAAVFPGLNHIVLEIGYGGGERLAAEARAHPETGFLGAEVFSGGVAKLVQTIDAENIGNIRLFTDDALKLLMALPEGSLSRVDLFYPDPWPKTRHHKRRFVSRPTLDELARVMKPQAPFRLATDIEDYANWALAHVLRHPAFLFLPERPGAWLEPYPGWVTTRYERKARAEGRTKSFYFSFPRA